MDWDDYNQRYQDFRAAMNQSELVANVAAEILSDFPISLPENWKQHLGRVFDDTAKALSQCANEVWGQAPTGEHQDSNRSSGLKRTVDIGPPDSFEARLSSLSVELIMLTSLAHPSSSGNPVPRFSSDFAEVVRSQQLVMGFAHTSAFLTDSVRTICMQRPAVLKSDKKIDWKTLIELGDWDCILSQMIEKYVYEFGWASISDITDSMRKRLGLPICIDPDTIDRIQAAELLRHLLVHTAGRVSSEYLARSGRTDLVLGQRVTIGTEIVHPLYLDLRCLALEVYSDVSEVHLGKKRIHLPFQQNKPPAGE